MSSRTRTLTKGLVLGLASALLLASIVWAHYYVEMRRYAVRNPDASDIAAMHHHAGAPAPSSPRYEWVDYDNVSRWLPRAVMAAEDMRFMRHGGVDWQAARDAYRTNAQAGRIVVGGSTLTQQLVKNLFLSRERTYRRKAAEMLLAMSLERTLSKRRILELYLNVIEWGDGIYGAQAAARHYYGIPAAELDRQQAAQLAARIPRPRHYSDGRTDPRLTRRAAEVSRLAVFASPPR